MSNTFMANNTMEINTDDSNQVTEKNQHGASGAQNYSADIPLFKVMLTLVKREYWENKVLFLYLPVIVSLAFSLIFIVSIVNMYQNEEFVLTESMSGTINFDLLGTNGLEEFARLPQGARESNLNLWFAGFIPLFFLFYWSSLIYYFLMSLYRQRKDRSILFWNSMPVSDAQTIFSKLLAGLVLGAGIYLLCLLLWQVIMLITMVVYGMQFDIDLWATIIAPANVPGRFLEYGIYLLLGSLWCLPIYGWLLLTSACSRSAPFAWAAGIPLVIALAELIWSNTFFLFGRIVLHTVPFHTFEYTPAGFGARLGMIMNTEMLISIVLGAVLIYAAIRLNKSEE